MNRDFSDKLVLILKGFFQNNLKENLMKFPIQFIYHIAFQSHGTRL